MGKLERLCASVLLAFLLFETADGPSSVSMWWWFWISLRECIWLSTKHHWWVLKEVQVTPLLDEQPGLWLTEAGLAAFSRAQVCASLHEWQLAPFFPYTDVYHLFLSWRVNTFEMEAEGWGGWIHFSRASKWSTEMPFVYLQVVLTTCPLQLPEVNLKNGYMKNDFSTALLSGCSLKGCCPLRLNTGFSTCPLCLRAF